MHAYIHTYIRTCVHTYLHTYLYTYIHTYLQTYVRILVLTGLPAIKIKIMLYLQSKLCVKIVEICAKIIR